MRNGKRRLSKKKHEKVLVLLVGDSILDNRFHADISTGELLVQKLGDVVLDSSVEETTTYHFADVLRDVPECYLEEAERLGCPYDTPKAELFPDAPNLQYVVLSVGGNDVVLNDQILMQLMLHPDSIEALADTLASNIVGVLSKYKKKYPSARVLYVKPYDVTADMVKKLAARAYKGELPQELLDSAMVSLNDALQKVIASVEKSGFDIIDPEWEASDVYISKDNIPEPTTRGAKQLAETIACQCEIKAPRRKTPDCVSEPSQKKRVT